MDSHLLLYLFSGYALFSYGWLYLRSRKLNPFSDSDYPKWYIHQNPLKKGIDTAHIEIKKRQTHFKPFKPIPSPDVPWGPENRYK